MYFIFTAECSQLKLILIAIESKILQSTVLYMMGKILTSYFCGCRMKCKCSLYYSHTQVGQIFVALDHCLWEKKWLPHGDLNFNLFGTLYVHIITILSFFPVFICLLPYLPCSYLLSHNFYLFCLFIIILIQSLRNIFK